MAIETIEELEASLDEAIEPLSKFKDICMDVKSWLTECYSSLMVNGKPSELFKNADEIEDPDNYDLNDCNGILFQKTIKIDKSIIKPSNVIDDREEHEVPDTLVMHIKYKFYKILLKAIKSYKLFSIKLTEDSISDIVR